jgi:hypothetical protein
MHRSRAGILLAVLAGFAAQAAVVYKWTDADGVIHFSDQPVAGAQKIYTATSTPVGSSPPAAAAHTPTPAAPPANAGGLAYTQFSITSPAPDQTFYGDEVVPVHLALEPELKAEQTITWHLNGKEVEQSATATQFALPRLDRGTYILAATITDPATGDSRTSDSVTFFVRQPSDLGPKVQHH